MERIVVSPRPHLPEAVKSYFQENTAIVLILVFQKPLRLFLDKYGFLVFLFPDVAKASHKSHKTAKNCAGYDFQHLV
jgi:hypothetical protein